MNRTRPAIIIANTVYAIGVMLVICLGSIALFGSGEPVNPDSMMRYSWRNMAFFSLAIGTIPMLAACTAVYKLNNVKSSARKKSRFLLLFLPGFICSACMLFVIGIIVVLMVRGYVHHLEWILSSN